MISDKKVLAIIPARGGSKEVPRKNVRIVAGKPLIAWTIEEAKQSKYIDRLILSSDDAEIIEVAQRLGCEVPFVRPSVLAQDDTPSIEVVFHAIEALPEKYDLVVLLQATSPLRTVEDIDACISYLHEVGAKSCVSVVEPDKSPYWMYKMTDSKHLVPLFDETFVRRQDFPETYALNGAVYIAECEWLKSSGTFMSKETVGYIMQKQRSWDIDTEQDITVCDYLINVTKRGDCI